MEYNYIKIKRILTIFGITAGIFLLLYPAPLSAREIGLEEALEWGVRHNLDLQNIRYSIEDIQRNLEILEAGKAFQVDLSITPIWRLGGEEKPFQAEMAENRFAPETEMTLSAKKLLTSDLSLTSNVTWQSDNTGLSDISPESLAKEVNGSLRLDQNLYPRTWSEQKKQVYALENSLIMKIEELKWEEVEKQIEFIQKYLNIVHSREQLELIVQRQALAEAELERVRKKAELGEGGYQQEAEAIIAMEEAKNKLWGAEQDLIQAQKQWSLLLSLPEEVKVDFDRNSDFLTTLFKQIDELAITEDIQDVFVEQVLSQNYRLKNSLLEKEEGLKELEWTRDLGKPTINLSGGYAYPDDSWFIMLDFQVKLADGGAQELKVQQKEEYIKRKELSIDYLKETLKLESEQLLKQDHYNQLVLQTQQLALEKEQDKLNIIEQQYQRGVISPVQWENSQIGLQEKELGVKQAYDQWFIDRMKLAHFLGYLPKGA